MSPTATLIRAVSNGILMEILYCICAVLLFSRTPTSVRQWGRIGATMGGFFCVKVLLKRVLLLLPVVGSFLDSFGTIYAYNPLLLLALGCCIKDLRWVTRLVSGVTFSAMFILCLSFVPNLMMAAFDTPMADVGQSPLNNLLTLLIVAATVWMLKKYSVEPIPSLSRNYAALVIFVSILSAVAAPVFSELLISSGDNAIFCAVYDLFAITLVVTVYIIFYQGSREYNALITAAVINQKQQAENRMLELTENNLEEIRKFRHDIKNHYAVMEELLKNHAYNELEKYFRSLTLDKSVLNTIQTGNRLVDAILNTKTVEAAGRGVSLETKCAIPPELPMDDAKLCSLIFNLLDNAIEAAAVSAGKQVDFSLLCKDNLLLLRIRNSVNRKTEARPISLRTTKANPVMHGYGIGIVRQIVEEYNGSSQFSIENDCFVAEIMLTLIADKEESNHA